MLAGILQHRLKHRSIIFRNNLQHASPVEIELLLKAEALALHALSQANVTDYTV
jgi:hypothetical protein